jgi:conjugal transfer pilus assembly protein TraB
MSLNVNVTTRHKQLAVFIGIIVVGAATAGGVMYFGGNSQAAAPPVTPGPNLTGVVTATFDAQVNQSALMQQQAKTSSLESQMAQLTQQVTQNRLDFENKLQRKDEQIQQLSSDLQKAGTVPAGQPTPPVASPNGTPLPGPLATGQARPPVYSVTPATGSGQATGTGEVNPAQGVGFYPAGSGPRMSGGLSTTTFTYDSLKKKAPKLPWIPSGSFSDAILIEGADANASVTGEQNTRPVTIRLLGKVQMPNDHDYDMSGCFVVGEIWGDISSERGEVRTRSLSCVLKNGKHVDMEFNGHVSYQGKGGIRGKPVMRNGEIVGYAGAAGLLSGFGEGIKSAATPVAGMGATASMGAGDVFKQGLGGGASKAADTLSQYWIKRAEQYHPIIDIGAGNRITVVFQKGFRLETLEDTEEQKAREALQNAAQTANNAATAQPATPSSGSTTTTAVSPASINPDEVLRQASQLRLGDTLN